MIRFTDATKLAATKLRTRKVRLAVTVVIAGLMFSVLAAASQISRGAFDSLADFNREGFGDRYITAAMPQYSQGNVNPASNPAVISRAEALQKDIIAKKTAEAKKLNIPYDPKNEPPIIGEYDGPNGKEKSIDVNSVAGKQALVEYYRSQPNPGLPELKRLSQAYAPKAFYRSTALPQGGDGPVLKVLQNGQEKYEAVDRNNNTFGQRGLDSFTGQWGLMSQDLFRPFMLAGANSEIGKDGSIPVIAPFSAIEQLLGLKEQPESTKPAQRLERIKQVREGASTVHFEVCYRNQTSQAKLQEAIAQQKEITANKDKKDYQLPALIYGLPKEACGPVVVQSDKRSATEKAFAAKQDQFNQMFSGLPAAQQQKMKFRVIGIAPDPPNYTASVASTIVSSIVSSNLSLFGPTWFSPIELEASQPLIKSTFDVSSTPAILAGANANFNYVEFNSAADAKRFVDDQSCEPDFTGFEPGKTPDASFDPYKKCSDEGKYFGYIPFGSNALALEDVKNGFNKIFTYAAIGVAVVAAIIMVGMVGRAIADSRRETAVFRAIGAKKIDIAMIYLIYTLFLSVLIFLFALLAGFIAAQFLNNRYADELTVQALVSYNAADLGKVFKLYSFYLPDLLRLLALSLAGGLLAASLPLLRNLRRNPINDMRDDT